MDNKKVLEKLVKIAQTQQKIIHKLAQQLPGGGDMVVGPSSTAVPSNTPPATSLKSTVPHKDLAGAIMGALGDFYHKNIASLAVAGSDVNVAFQPGKATQPNYDHVLATVKQLQAKNVLPGTSYNVKVV